MIENANLTIINNTITWFDSAYQKGIYLWWTNGTISNNSIENNTIGVLTNYYGPVIRGNNIANNVNYGVQNGDSTVTIDAELNWWNHATGPYHATGNPGGQGDTVSDYVTFADWLTGPAF